MNFFFFLVIKENNFFIILKLKKMISFYLYNKGNMMKVKIMLIIFY